MRNSRFLGKSHRKSQYGHAKIILLSYQMTSHCFSKNEIIFLMLFRYPFNFYIFLFCLGEY